MKLKYWSIGTLSLLSVLSMGRSFNNVNAIDIADPTNYDWKYDYDSTSARMEFTNSTAGASGVAVRYTSPSASNYETFDTSPIVNGETFPLELDMYFGLSTTAWTFSGGYYFPSSGVTFIGSNSATSTALKFQSIIKNPTPNFWQIGINLSDSVSSTPRYYLSYEKNISVTNGENLSGTVVKVTGTFTRSSTDIQWVNIPAYTDLELGLESGTTTAVYVRGLWFKQVGTVPTVDYNDAYNDGYEVGFDNGFIDGQDSSESNVLSRISLLLSTTFGGVRNVLNVKIFDQLTIGTIMLFPFAFVIVSFIFRLIRGGRS